MSDNTSIEIYVDTFSEGGGYFVRTEATIASRRVV